MVGADRRTGTVFQYLPNVATSLCNWRCSMPEKSTAVCQAEACDLQNCLGKNTYSPEKCDSYMRKLYECCEQMYATNEAAESTACPMRSVVKRWLDRHLSEATRNA